MEDGFSQDKIPAQARKGRGAVSNQLSTRFDKITRHSIDDGWEKFIDECEEETPKLKTEIGIDTSRSIISRNNSPDLGFSMSINPYRGCEHGCIYCFARPTHAYLGLSPGLDFETKIFYKPEAAALLRKELAAPSYKCDVPIMLGINTDAWQPVERKLQVTRSIVEVLNETSHPFNTITKSGLILRDLDLLIPMAQRNLVHVLVTIATLDPDIARVMDPRAPRPDKRIATVKALADAGIPVGVMTAPIIPGLTCHGFEDVLEAAAAAGARHAGYTVLRLPWELKELFEEWLRTHFPNHAERVLGHLREVYDGKLYNSAWGVRGRGTGIYAEMLRNRHHLACKRLGLNRREREEEWELDTTQFRKPELYGQMRLF